MNVLKLTSLLLVTSLSTIAYNQITGLGVQTKMNSARHQYHNPNQPEHGVSATDNLVTIGGDLYLDYQITSAFTLRGKFGYESKGLTNRYHNGLSNNKTIDTYQFNYASADIVLNYHLIQLDPILKIYPIAGLSFGYLINDNLEMGLFTPSHYASHFDDYNTFNLGAVYGVGINIKNLIWCEAEWNNDILAPIKRNELVARNRVFSVNLGLNILGLLQK